MTNYLFFFYLAGCAIYLVKFVNFFSLMKKMPSNITDNFLSGRMLRYMILKSIFWPWYFFIEKSPLERFSEKFFKYYGDEGITYFGVRGLRNFVNDVLFGKNRYEGLIFQKHVWPISEDSEAYYINQNLGSPVRYVKFVLAKKKDNYLLGLVSSDDKREYPTSRYTLDDCIKYRDKEDILERLYYFNPEKAKVLKI